MLHRGVRFDGGERFQCPVFQTRHLYLLFGEVTVIGTVAQRTVRIIETHVFNAAFLQCALYALFAHSLDLVVHLQGCTGREYHIGTLALFVDDQDNGLVSLVGMLLDFVSHEEMLGHLLPHLFCLAVVAIGGILDFLAPFRLAYHFQRIVHIALDGIYQTRALFQLTVPIIHQFDTLVRQPGRKSHFQHLDTRSDFGNQPFLLDGILCWGNPVFHHHSLTGKALLVSSGCYDLPKGLLRVIGVMCEILLPWNIYRVFLAVIMRHTAAIRANRCQISRNRLYEGIEFRPELTQFLFSESLLDTVAVFCQCVIVCFPVNVGQQSLVDIEQCAYLPVVYAFVSVLLFGRKFLVVIP